MSTLEKIETRLNYANLIMNEAVGGVRIDRDAQRPAFKKTTSPLLLGLHPTTRKIKTDAPSPRRGPANRTGSRNFCRQRNDSSSVEVEHFSSCWWFSAPSSVVLRRRRCRPVRWRRLLPEGGLACLDHRGSAVFCWSHLRVLLVTLMCLVSELT